MQLPLSPSTSPLPATNGAPSASSANKTQFRKKAKYYVFYLASQSIELEKEFRRNKYVIRKRKSELSQMFNLSERQVKIWFQNRRAKARKNDLKKSHKATSDSSKSSSSPSFSVLDIDHTVNIEMPQAEHPSGGR